MIKMNNQSTENKILEAAEQEFMTKGFAGARTTSIAEKAGVTHAMFHYYFRTKEKIFERIVSEKLMMLRNIIGGSIIDESLTLDEIIKKLIESHLDFLSANPNLPRFLITEIFGNPDRIKIVENKIGVISKPIIKIMQNIIDKEFEKGKCRKVDAKLILLDIISLNVFPYMASPIINASLQNYLVDEKKFLEERKKENYDTLMRKLKL